jgi:hypothetical protein
MKQISEFDMFSPVGAILHNVSWKLYVVCCFRSAFRLPHSEFLSPPQLQRLDLSPAGIADGVVDLPPAEIHDDGQTGDNLQQGRYGRISVDTDGIWLVHVIFENILDPCHINVTL